MSLMDEAAEVVALVRAIKPFLAGRASEVQGAALAGLLAIWLAEQVLAGDPKATEAYREKVLKLHLDAVRLLTVNYETRIEPKLKRSQQ